ncbi:hypothetical protein V6N13_039271 [Hibiscus sabdariffa]
MRKGSHSSVTILGAKHGSNRNTNRYMVRPFAFCLELCLLKNAVSVLPFLIHCENYSVFGPKRMKKRDQNGQKDCSMQ